MNGSKKQVTAGVEDPADPKGDPLESRPRRDVHRDLMNLASQVQMMSDSLAACKQLSKARPLRKMYSVQANAQADPMAMAPQASVQVLLSPDEKTPQHRDDEEERGVIVSYMVRETQKLTKTESDGTDSFQQQGCSRRRGSRSSVAMESLEPLKGSSTIQMYEHGEVDPSRMVDVIQRELKALMEMAPPVALLAIALSDTICHCKECDRCSEKISASLPWILNRIQKLIKYVTTQRQGSYRWPDDRSYLRVRPPESTAPPAPTEFPSRASGRVIAKLDRIDAVSVAEDIPGLQLVLEVRVDASQKKLFEKAENRPAAPGDTFLNFSVVQLREPESVPLVHVLQPRDEPKILVDEKREAVALREFAHAPRLVYAFRLSPLASLLPAIPAGSLTRSRRHQPSFHPRPPDRAPSQERSVHPRKKNAKGPPQGQCKGGEKTVRQSDGLPTKPSNDKDPSSPRDLLARVPEIVREFLREAEAEKMHDQKVRNLEAGAKGLRDLMTEVHRNQLELSKVLLEKGVYPQPIIKLTDPDMLEKENEVMRRVAELQEPDSKHFSLEALQTAVDDLKHRCALKNRVILIILKGLRSNIPKEWWEDMVEYVFDEGRPIEDFDPENVTESLRRASAFPGNGEQASGLQARPLRTEEQPSEEEPSVKGNVGADVEEYLGKSWKDDGVAEKTREVTSTSDPEGLSEGVVSLPAAESPTSVSTSIRKLENHISLLNAENEKLRHEIDDLKNLLRNSVEELRQSRGWDQRASGKAAGKTINLTIEIVDKELRPVKEAMKLKNVSVAYGSGGGAISHAVERRDGDSSSDLKESEAEEGEPSQEPPGAVSSMRSESGSERERSEGEWNCLDGTSSTVADHRGGTSTVPRERVFGCSSNRAVAIGHPSGQEVLRKLKPVAWVPSKYRIPEVSEGCRAGPSRKPVDVGRLPQKPSLMELAESQSRGSLAAMANERELQTIPENDCSPSSGCPSKGMSQAIQLLRTRVRSIHKDVTVLKSKNDRIDKLLDRLMDDAVENSESFQEMENNLNLFKDQLG